LSSLPETIVLDTCVLISNVLRRALLHLAAQGCFELAWSPVIGDEWRRNAARLWGVSDADVQEQWDALQVAFPLADQGDVSEFKSGLRRSDPKDWHVVAAGRAVLARRPQGGVAIVTRNIRDFNRSELRGLGLELLDPDQLLLRCWQERPALMSDLLSKLPDYALAPGRDLEAVDVILRRERLFRLNRLCACPA
jgi:predicted nucleic acid-binding protein